MGAGRKDTDSRNNRGTIQCQHDLCRERQTSTTFYDVYWENERRQIHRISATTHLQSKKAHFFLILDGHPVHKSRQVKEFVATTEGKLRLFILPPYSPHLNPDEWVWNWLKKHNLGKTRISGPDQFKAAVNLFMRRLQKLPKIVRGFFCDPNLAYINI